MLEGRRVEAAVTDSAESDAGRQLTAHLTYSVVYQTFATDASCPGATPDTQGLNTYGLFDTAAYNQPVLGLYVNYDCADVDWYATAGGQYCKEDNVEVTYTDLPEVRNARCIDKCGTRGTTRGTDDDPRCAGFQIEMEEYPDSAALCLFREECEAACDAVAGCVSIDMHHLLPRCYLNKECSELIN